MSVAMLRAYRALVLDFDGTLVSTFEDVSSCMATTFRAFGQGVPSRELVRTTMGLPLEEAFRRLGQTELTEHELQKWVRVYRELYATRNGSQTRLFPGAMEFLKDAKDKGIQVIIVSNKGKAAINSALERLGVGRFVTCVFAGDDILYRKPDPRLYDLQISAVIRPYSREDSLVVGDTETDLLFARNCAVHSCWVSYGYGDREACLQLSPTYIVDSLLELKSAIQRRMRKSLVHRT